MERAVLMRGFVVAMLATGCLRTTSFHCATSADCTNGGATGTCQATGYCSFADGTCTSGQRYGGLSGPYANQCTGGQADAGVDALPDAPAGYYYIGGTVSGLTHTGLQLQDNSTDTLSLTTDGAFRFMTALMSGRMYSVTVLAQPSEQTCSIGFGSGTVGTADVTSVGINCNGTGDPGIRCGVTHCTPTPAFCCNPEKATASCAASCTGNNTKMQCDDAADCAGVAGNPVCCIKVMGGAWQSNLCASACALGDLVACDPTLIGACSGVPGTTCQPFTAGLPSGYFACQ